ncbi:hypothetical protein DES41_1075 [Pseudorhodoferax soli]|uniref:DUF6351 domain-containing protein n=2 Tax=Pseudorhodoferax soli TaxID=545864 RepID=A0A368XR48_9BURK|nr:hypothetical protein DES41_1075 [Pseudorhodoferax soli]
MVSDGSALLKISLPEGVVGSDVKVTREAVDVTANFKQSGEVLVGLIDGLSIGPNVVTVLAKGGVAKATLVNHDKNGPIISGPHQMPWACETERLMLRDGTSFGKAIDENCNAPTRTTYVYRTTSGEWKNLAAPFAIPADMSTTTSLNGNTVNYIVRVETGTLNRGIYQIAMLYDPNTEPQIAPGAAYKGWNGKAMYIFGGGVGSGYRQGFRLGTNVDVIASGPFGDEHEKLSRGFALLTSTLNLFQNNGSDVLSAETASMVKERFIKTYGEPIYVMGWGGSGGAMQQHLIANNYPGILDGIVPSGSFPDTHTTLPSDVDCSLMHRAFDNGNEVWTDEEKTAASGWNTWETCPQWESIYSPTWVVATATNIPETNYGSGLLYDFNTCPLSMPPGTAYDPITNPSGARCDLYSGIKNLLGIDPLTGFPARAYDNEGLQYGLGAYRNGKISAEKFVELNELAGGYTVDGALQAGRTQGSYVALNAMYEFGRVNEGGNLGGIPIIDTRTDPGKGAQVHDSLRSITMRERLVRSNGSAANQVMLKADGTPPVPGSAQSPANLDKIALLAMDQWLSSVKADKRSYASAMEKVVSNKPAGLSDGCYLNTGEVILESFDASNNGRCGTLMPVYSNPRIVAGAPLTDDVLKCQLKAIQAGDYPGMALDLFTRLRAVFPNGVCDFSKPGIGVKPLKGTYLEFGVNGLGTAEVLK